MAPEKCPHSDRVNGLVNLDFGRQADPDGAMYSGAVTFGICEECGHIELYVNSHRWLCNWLRET
jgi:hypothetical protein